MAAATLQIITQGRGPGVFPNMSAIEVTVTAVATVYAAASGGLPVDLVTIMQQAAPSGWNGPAGIQALHPADIVGAITPMGVSTNGFLATLFTLGTPVWTTPPPGLSTTDSTAAPGFLTSCPGWIRLTGIGASSSNHAGFGEAADGAVTETFTFLLYVNRNGANT